MYLYLINYLKKTTAILFILLIIISHIGYYYVHVMQHFLVKQEVKESLFASINEKDLVAIEETNPYLIWTDNNGNECTLLGKLYDVVKKETINGKKILYCKSDTKEEKLISDFAKCQQTQDDCKNKQEKHTLKIHIEDCTIQSLVEHTFQLFKSASSCNEYFSYEDTLITASSEITSPPPRS